MKNLRNLFVAGATIGLVCSDIVIAQDVFVLDEIIVTGRKREESLQDIPVSATVITSETISGAGLLTQKDLFDLTPGLHYDEGGSRNTALPSVRGVQSNEEATNRTKVTAFIDGMPLLGAQGSIAFTNLQQIEVYRGPQSAAFGRSTFGGAVNYITRDPGEEFEGAISADANGYGRRIFNASVSGPISDSVAFLIDASLEDSDAYDDYIATDLTEFGKRSGTSILGKLQLFPTEHIEAEFAINHVETDDTPVARYFISEDARNACFDGTVSQGLGGGLYQNGAYDCDWSQGSTIAAQYDREGFLSAAGETNEDILFLASGQSIPESDVGSYNSRTRFSFDTSYNADDGSKLQFLAFHSDEEYVTSIDTVFNSNESITIVPNGMGEGYIVELVGMNATQGPINSDPTDIDEQYAELRWVSPEAKRIRYVVGTSYYNYDFLSQIYFGGYGAVLQGEEAVARYDSLNAQGGSVGIPTQLFSEQANNLGAFFNLTYDFTENLTGAFEGRYQVDEVKGADESTGAAGSVKTSTFLPRLSLTYTHSDSLSLYGQISKGNNPAGVNVDFFDDDIRTSLDAADVSYDSSTFDLYEEETLFNYEVGAKGSLANEQFKYAFAAFFMDWNDQAQSVNLDWGAGGPPQPFSSTRAIVNEGDLEITGIEFESDYLISDDWSLRSTLTLLDAKYADYCSVELVGSGFVESTDLVLENASADGRPYDCYDVSGNSIAQQPSLSASLSPSYLVYLGDRGTYLGLRADVVYEGAEYLDAANVAELPAVMTANLSLTLGGDNWSTSLYVNNLTDEDQPLKVETAEDPSIVGLNTALLDAGATPASNYLITPRTPRTLGLRASYQF